VATTAEKSAERSNYSLYRVSYSDENKHAATVFLHCVGGRTFATGEAGYCESGELLLAEWGEDTLSALYKAEVVENTVRTKQCIKGWGRTLEVPLSIVTDHRD